LIGTVAGILNIIPFAGPILGSVPAMLLALAKSPLTALGVLITFLAIHEIEKQLILLPW
jgi:predicted PurR-regulated permease PerM